MENLSPTFILEQLHTRVLIYNRTMDCIVFCNKNGRDTLILKAQNIRVDSDLQYSIDFIEEIDRPKFYACIEEFLAAPFLKDNSVALHLKTPNGYLLFNVHISKLDGNSFSSLFMLEIYPVPVNIKNRKGDGLQATDSTPVNEIFWEENDETNWLKALNLSLHAMVITDLTDNTIQEVNTAFVKLTGYTQDEVKGLTSKSIGLFHDIRRREELADIVRSGKSFISKEAKIVTKSGEIQHVLLSGDIITYKGKTMMLTSAISFSHILKYEEELFHTKKKLEENEERLRLSLKAAQQGLYDLNVQTGEAIVNDEYAIMLGYDPATFKETNSFWESRLHPSDKQHTYKAYTDYINGKIPEYKVEFRHLNADNKWIWILSMGKIVSYDEKGMPLRMLGTHTDITYLKQIEAELREEKEKVQKNEAMLEQLFENMEQGFALHEMIYDENGNPIDYKFILINKAFEKQTRIETKRFIGKTVKEVLPQTENYWIEKYGRVASTGVPIEFEDYSVEFDRYYHVMAYSPQKNYFAVLFTDVTQNRKFEHQLILAKDRAEESDKLKSAFMRNISHEFRTPMNAISGYVDLLDKPDLSVGKQKHYKNIIHQSVNQLLYLVENTITIAHLETHQLELNFIQVKLNNFFHEILLEFGSNEKLSSLGLVKLLAITPPNMEVEIKTDYNRLVQIFRILLNNAIKYTDSGTIEIGYQVHEDLVKCYVTDTGIGIPEDFIKFIGKSYTGVEQNISTLKGGTGIGLSIVKGILELMHTKLYINSTVGKGSSFYFYLPIHSISEVENIPDVKVESSKYNILVAEDEEFNFMYIAEILEDEGFHLIHARNGKEAVEWFKKQPFDIILMDIKMPVMDGFEATLKIREINKQIPIIAQTAFAYRREQCINAGFTDYLTKPYSSAELLLKLNTELQRIGKDAK